METLKKFSRRGMRKAIEEAIDNMSDNKACETCAGVYNLFKIMNQYYVDKYGSTKRMQDLYEYVKILQSAYLKKNK